MIRNSEKWLVAVLVGLLALTACSAKTSETTILPAVSNSESPITTELSRTEEVQISLDIACEYVRKGFDFEGFDNIDAEVNFDVAADTFREVILDYQIAQQFMDGAVAASREAHRWADGSSLLQGARNGNYIRGKDAESIVSMYNYCVASDITQSD